MTSSKRQLLVILGPTATGKTDFGLRLAKKFNGELVSCDSRQVYVGLDIGSGKLPGGKWKIEDGRWKKSKGFWEIDGVKVWMYDVVDFKRQYSVADYVKDANKVIENIINRKKLPIIVGGTGLYLKALLEGLPNLVIPMDKELRKELKFLLTADLQKRLQQIAPERWEKMNNSDRQNPRRLIRAIELTTASLRRNLPIPMKIAALTPFARNDILKIGLTASRDILYIRADERVRMRIKQDMVGEAEKLYEKGLSLKRTRELGLEYGVLADYMDGKIKNIDDLVKIMQGEIHGFIRRQLTWFKKEKNIYWFDISKKDFYHDVEKVIAKWYY